MLNSGLRACALGVAAANMGNPGGSKVGMNLFGTNQRYMALKVGLACQASQVLKGEEGKSGSSNEIPRTYYDSGRDPRPITNMNHPRLYGHPL